ncbi:HpcH/HpaI aldolase family protein [Sciscionella sediminilitoris]|uniref:HpcH/HpaI aldolase family protein n=1 Tax=Sciscionella sediminilitoris TaxID=1445613 RepID=UPI0004DF5955|nr:aldolase/citrate lyase family protein [Sciscionella sp. SE31]
MSMFDKAAAPIGTWLKIPAPEPVEILAHAGFDFVVVDLEHAPLSLETAYRLINSAAALGLTPLVRVPDHTPSMIQKILDAGAHGVLVPKVDSAEQARAVCRAMRFPPDGDRGAGGTSKAGRWGLRPAAEYYAQRPLCIPQLESEQAIRSAADILALSDVDAVFVGPADLSLSLGTTPDDAVVRELIGHAIREAKAAGKPCGIAFGDAPPVAAAIEDGCGFALVSNDTGMLAKAAGGLLERLRGAE